MNDKYKPERKEKGAAGEVKFEGLDFCRDLEYRARLRAREQSATGWALAIGSVLAVGFGTILTAATPDAPSDARKLLNAGLPVAGTGFAYLAFGQFARSEDASALAAAASAAANLEDKKANEACNAAIGTWNSSRSDAAKALMDAVKNGSKTEPPPPGG